MGVLYCYVVFLPWMAEKRTQGIEINLDNSSLFTFEIWWPPLFFNLHTILLSVFLTNVALLSVILLNVVPQNVMALVYLLEPLLLKTPIRERERERERERQRERDLLYLARNPY